jgi:hypothetical protein
MCSWSAIRVSGVKVHCENEVNEVQTIRTSFPFVLLFSPNNVNNVNNALKSMTCTMNETRTKSEQREHVINQ